MVKRVVLKVVITVEIRVPVTGIIDIGSDINSIVSGD